MPVEESNGENGSGRSGIDPHPFKSDANALSHFNDNYASGADSGVEGTPQKNSTSRKGFRVPLISSGTPSLASVSVCRLLLYSCTTQYCHNVLCCTQDYSGYRDIKLKFRYCAVLDAI